MARLGKIHYYTKNEKKVNCYHINLPKSVVSKSNIKDTDEVKIYAENDKIIIEKQK